MKERFAPSMADKEACRLCNGSGLKKGFNTEQGFGCLGVLGNDDVCVDIMQGNCLGSAEKVSFIVSPSFFDTSSLHIYYNGTELMKCDSSQFNWHGSGVSSRSFFGDFWRGTGAPIVLVSLTVSAVFT